MRRLLIGLVLIAGCKTEDASTAVVENGSGAVIYRAWWSETLFPDPIPPGSASEEFRTTPATDTAYVLLAPGWDPASGAPPTSFVVLRSKAPLDVNRGGELHIAVSDTTFDGNCGASAPLSREDAAFAVNNIFAGELEGFEYDAATCTTRAR
jgi:hypothetical protein